MVDATPHVLWITSRAAGIVALVLASLAVSLGLVMSLKFMRRRGPDLLAMHEILSLAALVAIAVHGLALLGDQFLHPSIADIAIPFVFGYKTLWTSLGIIAGWGLAILGLSYYFRRYIGFRRWRKLPPQRASPTARPATAFPTPTGSQRARSRCRATTGSPVTTSAIWSRPSTTCSARCDDCALVRLSRGNCGRSPAP